MDSATCPDCNAQVPLKDIKQHIKKCQKYKPIFLPHLLSLSKYIDSDQLQFQLKQIQLVNNQINTQRLQNLHNKQKNSQEQQNNLKRQNFSDSQSQQQVLPIKNFYSIIEQKKNVNTQVEPHLERKTLNTRQKQSQRLDKISTASPQHHHQQKIQIPEQAERQIKKLNNLVTCQFCTFQFQFEPKRQQFDKSKNKRMGEKQIEDYNNNRVVCPMCDKQQCRRCKKSPFHQGKICQYDNQSSYGFCATHGKQYLVYKCQFCCSISTWKWRNRHLCDKCNTKYGPTERKGQKYFAQIQQCGGPEVCPIGGKHIKNGKQYILGCALCQNFDFSKKS